MSDVRLSLVNFDAPLVPEFVVPAHAAFRQRLIADARRMHRQVLRVAIQLLASRCLVRGRLLGGQHIPAGQGRGRTSIDHGTLQRCERPEREQPLNIGITIRRPQHG